MQLGIDFDGTFVEYVVCYRHGAGDGRVLQRFSTQEEAEQMTTYKRKIAKPDRTYWVMRITHHYERITGTVGITDREPVTVKHKETSWE